MKEILRDTPYAERVRDDWGEELRVKARNRLRPRERGGLTNLDVAASSATGINGSQVWRCAKATSNPDCDATPHGGASATFRHSKPLCLFHGRSAEDSLAAGIECRLHHGDGEATPLKPVPDHYGGLFSKAEAPPSEVLDWAMPRLRPIQAALPPGYKMEIAGEYREEQQKGFKELAVMAISIVMIYLALVIQFRNAIKPFIVFAVIS